MRTEPARDKALHGRPLSRGVICASTSPAVARAVAEDAGGQLSTAVLLSGRSCTDAVTAAPLTSSLGAPATAH